MAKEQVQNVADEEVRETNETNEIEFEPEYGDMIPVPDLMVVREKYSKKGKDYWCYRINTTLRGVDTHVDFRMGEDIGAYRLLDIVFGQQDKVQFAVQPYKTKNMETKQVRKGYKYFAVLYDQDLDMTYYADLRPAQQSDRTIIDLVLVEISRRTGISFDA